MTPAIVCATVVVVAFIARDVALRVSGAHASVRAALDSLRALAEAIDAKEKERAALALDLEKLEARVHACEARMGQRVRA